MSQFSDANVLINRIRVQVMWEQSFLGAGDCPLHLISPSAGWTLWVAVSEEVWGHVWATRGREPKSLEPHVEKTPYQVGTPALDS